jgi:rubrerythrin
MALLQAEPPEPVRSLEELFAIAFVMEEEAAARYGALAERMRTEGNPDLATVFDMLASEERGHAESVTRWSGRVRGAPPNRARLPWHPPETFDDEEAGITDARLQTAYRSLSMAVRNEERAFAFWTYVAAHAEDGEIREAAERMAREELGHVATLRRERRRAFHGERDRRSANVADPAQLEARMAELLDQAAGKASGVEMELLARLARQARDTARQLADEPLPRFDATLPPSDIPADPVLLAEAMVDLYLDAGDRMDDQSALGRVQSLASNAIARLSQLRADLGALR